MSLMRAERAQFRSKRDDGDRWCQPSDLLVVDRWRQQRSQDFTPHRLERDTKKQNHHHHHHSRRHYRDRHQEAPPSTVEGVATTESGAGVVQNGLSHPPTNKQSQKSILVIEVNQQKHTTKRGEKEEKWIDQEPLD